MKGMESNIGFALLDRACREATTLDFSYGKGSELMQGNTHGSALAAYLLIDNPPLTFEQFYGLLFPNAMPDTWRNGFECIDAMTLAVYGDMGTDVTEEAGAEESEKSTENIESPNDMPVGQDEVGDGKEAATDQAVV